MLASKMVEEVLLKIKGLGFATYETVGSLGTTMDLTTTTITLQGGTDPNGSVFTGGGYFEIGEEIVYCENINPTGGIATGVLRGQLGTDPQVHQVGAGVIQMPKFPRYAVFDAINDAIDSLSSMGYYVFDEDTVTGNPVLQSYDIDGAAEGVVTVQYQNYGPEQRFQTYKNWDFDYSGGPASQTGKSVYVDRIIPGRPIRIVYWKYATRLDDYSSDFSESGLDSSLQRIIVTMASAYLLSYADLGLAQAQDSGSRDIAGNARGAVSNQTVSKYLLQQATSEVQQLITRQRKQYPIKRHYGVR